MSLASLKEVGIRAASFMRENSASPVQLRDSRESNQAEWNHEGCETPSAMDKIRRSLVFISVEVTVPGVSPGRQATLSFLGRSLFFWGCGWGGGVI